MKNDLNKMYAKSVEYNNDLEILKDYLVKNAFFTRGGNVIISNKMPANIKDLINDIDRFIETFVITCSNIFYDRSLPIPCPNYLQEGLCLRYDNTHGVYLIMLDPFSYGM